MDSADTYKILLSGVHTCIHPHPLLYPSWKCKIQTFGEKKKKSYGQRMSAKHCPYQIDQEPDQSTYSSDEYSTYCKISFVLWAIDLSSLRTSTLYLTKVIH